MPEVLAQNHHSCTATFQISKPRCEHLGQATMTTTHGIRLVSWFLKIQFWSWPERADWEAPCPLQQLHRLWLLGSRNPTGAAPLIWTDSTFDFDAGSGCGTRNCRADFGRSLLQPRPHCSEFWQVVYWQHIWTKKSNFTILLSNWLNNVTHG